MMTKMMNDGWVCNSTCSDAPFSMYKSAEDHGHGLVAHRKGGKLQKNIEKVLQSAINIEKVLISRVVLDQQEVR